jgi:hypothetical protein
MCPAIRPWRGMSVFVPIDFPHLAQNVADSPT